MNKQHLELARGEYLISTDPARLDPVAIHQYLTRSYWAKGIPLDVVRRSLEGSLCFGLYHDSRQVGFARVITDRATFAYLGDVYVLEQHRGVGLGKWLMDTVFAHPALSGLRRFILATRDAHSLYARYGFTPLRNPAGYLEIHRPEIYQANSAEARFNSSATDSPS
jgi:GNAT superfamily N-acetyltransferase